MVNFKTTVALFQFLTTTMCVIVGVTSDSATFFIVTTPGAPCRVPERNETSDAAEEILSGSGEVDNESCLTLQQFSRRFNNYLHHHVNVTDVRLEFDTGEHIFDSQTALLITNITSLATISEAATIICTKSDAKLELNFVFRFIENITISGIEFVGCGNIEVSFVEQFTLENSSIQKSFRNGTLTLYHVDNASIVKSTILEMQQSDCDNPALNITRSTALFQQCTFSNNKRVIDGTLSTITIDGCTFENNSVPDNMVCSMSDWAVITIENGPQSNLSVTVINSNFTHNNNLFNIFYGSIYVLHNNFVENTNYLYLLYIYTHSNNVIIEHNNFIENNCYLQGAVQVEAADTAVSIKHNKFISNIGGVLSLTPTGGTLTISNSTFYGNKGRDYQSDDGIYATASYLRTCKEQ